MKEEGTAKEARRILVLQHEGKKRGHYFRPRIKVVLKGRTKGRRRRR